MRCLSLFINKKLLGKQLCVGTCLKCLTVATPLTISVGPSQPPHSRLEKVGRVFNQFE